MDSAIYIALPFISFQSCSFGKTSGFPRSRWSAQMASTMYIVDTCSRTEGFVLRTGHMQDRHVHPLQAMMACDTLKIISCSVFLGWRWETVSLFKNLGQRGKFGGKKPGFDSRNKGLVVVFGSACNNPDEVVGFTWQGHLEERTYGSTKPARFLHGNIFCKVWKKRPAGLSEGRLKNRVSFDGVFFQASFLLAGSTGGCSWQHVSRTSKMWGTNFQKPDQGNRGGESCKGCLSAGKGGDLILVGSARLYLFEYIIYIYPRV